MKRRLESKDITARLKEIEDYLLQQYKESKEEKERDWKTYEQKLTYRTKEAIKNFQPLIDEAISTIEIHRGRGRKPTLTLKQKVTLLLLKDLFGKSNRNMASMLAIFSLLSEIDVSYKVIERLYSDPEVVMTIFNLHNLILKKKGVKNVNASGDGTGYSLTIGKHYASETKRRKDKAKSSDSEEKNKMGFVYSFKLLDIDTKMYIAYGTSLKSEKEAFERAMKMLEKIDTKINSVRLDKYYSYPSYVDRFEGANVYIIPKKNSTLRGSWKWKETMKEFVENTIPYLNEYYRRNSSESAFSVDKRWFGWKIQQRRWDRINTAEACTNIWHNLFNLYTLSPAQ